LARAILGPPPPEVPPKPSFSTPLPKEVPMTLPVPKVVPEAEEIPDGLKGAPNDVLSANF